MNTRRPSGDRDSLRGLTELQEAAIAEWMLGGMSNKDTAARIKAEYGIDVKPQRMSRFWQRVCEPALLARRSRIAGTAHLISADAANKPGYFTQAATDLLAQRTTEMLIRPGIDPAQIKDLYSLMLQFNKLQLAREQLALNRRRVEVLEKRAALADQAENTAKDTSLTAEQRLQRVREIFSLPVLQLPPPPAATP